MLLLVWSVVWGGAAELPPENRGGVSYLHEELPAGPWSIHVVKIDRRRKDLHLVSTLGNGANLGMNLISEQAKALPASLGRPLAAINGDFYRNTRGYPGDPEGLQISRGDLVSAPAANRPCFWIDDARTPHATNVIPLFTVTLPDGTPLPFGLNEECYSDELVLYTGAKGRSTGTSGGIEFLLKAEGDKRWMPLGIGQNYTAIVQKVSTQGNMELADEGIVLSAGRKLVPQFAQIRPGTVLKLSFATTPDLRGVDLAIGGGPMLVSHRAALPFKGMQPRHPRSAVGWNTNHIFFVEVDGRQNESVGMTWPELAAYFVKLGCDEAMNLDGGGSATLWVCGTVMNSPSEGRERPAANALVVVQEKKKSK